MWWYMGLVFCLIILLSFIGDKARLDGPEGSKLRCPLGMIMVLDPVEVFGSTPGVADKVKAELDNGTGMVSLSGSLEALPSSSDRKTRVGFDR